jgi:hypothetical protein
MTLQALKEAEFESSSLRVVPVAVQRVVSLKDLPLISYGFQAANGTGHYEKVFYDVSATNTRRNGMTSSNFRVLAKNMVNALFGMDIRLVGSRAAYWENDIQFISQTMQNLYAAKARGDVDNMRTDGATIHGRGDIYVPLVQGAVFRIANGDPEERPDDINWDVIVTGEVSFFGEARPFTIHHAHCQGFALPPLDVTMEEVMAMLFKWFPFLDGHVSVINRSYVSNPVTHQDRL